VDTLIDSLTAEWQALVRLTPRVVLAVLVLLLLIWIGRVVGRLTVRLLEKGKLTRTHKSFFRHLVSWSFALLGIVIGLNLLGLQGVAAGLMAGGGLTAVVLGFAFRGIGENFLAGFFLAFSRPFEIGDIIQSGEFVGEVRGIELRCTHIRTGDGRDVYVPSSNIFNQPVVNFTRDGLRRLSFVVGIDYGDDTERARRVLLEAAKTVEHVLEDPPPAVAVSAMLAQYQELEVSFWVDVFKKGVSIPVVRSRAMELCRRSLRTHGFTMSSEVTTSVLIDEPTRIGQRETLQLDNDTSTRKTPE